MDVANSLVTCALCRLRLYPSPQILMFIPEASSLDLCREHRFPVNRTHPHGRCHMTDGVVWRSLLYLYSQATSGSLRHCLSQSSSLDLHLKHCFSINRAHLYGRGCMYFEKRFNVIMS